MVRRPRAPAGTVPASAGAWGAEDSAGGDELPVFPPADADRRGGAGPEPVRSTAALLGQRRRAPLPTGQVGFRSRGPCRVGRSTRFEGSGTDGFRACRHPSDRGTSRATAGQKSATVCGQDPVPASRPNHPGSLRRAHPCRRAARCPPWYGHPRCRNTRFGRWCGSLKIITTAILRSSDDAIGYQDGVPVSVHACGVVATPRPRGSARVSSGYSRTGWEIPNPCASRSGRERPGEYREGVPGRARHGSRSWARRRTGTPPGYSVVLPSKCSSEASATFFVLRTIPSWCSGGE